MSVLPFETCSVCACVCSLVYTYVYKHTNAVVAIRVEVVASVAAAGVGAIIVGADLIAQGSVRHTLINVWEHTIYHHFTIPSIIHFLQVLIANNVNEQVLLNYLVTFVSSGCSIDNSINKY